MSKGVNSSAPTTGEIIAGVYNATPPTLVDGQAAALQVDINGQLKTAGGGGGGGNVNITGINGSAPALANPLPVELSDGTNPVGTAGNPLSVNVITGGGSNASVGTTGVLAPTSATEIGVIDGTGKLQGASASNPVRVDPTGTTTQPVSGTVTANAGANLNTSALALDATLTNATQKTKIVDTGGVNVASVSAAGAVKVDGSAATQPVSGTVTANQGTNNATPWNENIAQWGGTAVTAPAITAPVGTEAAPVIRPVLRKSGSVLTTANLGSGAVFTGAWIDTNQTGDHFAEASVFATTIGSATNGFAIQESDDSTDSNMTSIICRQTISASVLTTIQAVIRCRFWRVVYTNGAGTTGSLKITATGSTTIPYTVIAGQATNGSTVPAASLAGQTTTSQGGASIVTSPLAVAISSNSMGTDNSTGAAATCTQSGAGGSAFAVVNYLANTGGASGFSISAQRTPTVFKTIAATATGNTAVWTPTSGKKFRLMRYMIQVTGNAALAAGAVVTISFQDAAAAIGLAAAVFIPTATFTGAEDFVSPWVDLGNGFLSAAANNVLNINLTAALTAGVVQVTVCGTEE